MVAVQQSFFFDTLATIVCIQNLEQGFIDRVRSNSIRLVFGEKILICFSLRILICFSCTVYP